MAPEKRSGAAKAKRWAVTRLTATVINDIAVEIAFFSLWATAVCLISKHRTDLAISSQMLTVLGTVLGLVVSFRTSSAYDRYWEGRKLWSSLQLQSRNLASIIWVQIPLERKSTADKPLPKDWRLRAIIEKKTMVNLVQGFSVSVKHYLRGESGIFYEDLYPLVSFLPQHSVTATSVGEDYDFKTADDMLPIWVATEEMRKRRTSIISRHRSNLPTVHEEAPRGSQETHGDPEKDASDASTGPKMPEGIPGLLPARLPPKQSIYDYAPFLLPIKPLIALIMHFARPDRERSGRDWMGRKRKPQISVESNVPLEIILFLQSYLAWVIKEGLVTPPISSAFWAGLSSFQDTVTALERVRSTPIPYAYQMHLRMSIWLYLLFLPFQVLSALNWITIPGTAFASFLFLGFLEIGAEIENPFDYDENDLDLDRFCEAIGKELAEITAHPVVDPSQYIFGEWNNPFAPADNRSAGTIIANVEHDYHHPEIGAAAVRRTLLRSWRTTSDQKLDHPHM